MNETKPAAAPDWQRHFVLCSERFDELPDFAGDIVRAVALRGYPNDREKQQLAAMFHYLLTRRGMS